MIVRVKCLCGRRSLHSRWSIAWRTAPSERYVLPFSFPYFVIIKFLKINHFCVAYLQTSAGQAGWQCMLYMSIFRRVTRFNRVSIWRFNRVSIVVTIQSCFNLKVSRLFHRCSRSVFVECPYRMGSPRRVSRAPMQENAPPSNTLKKI